MRSLTTSYHFLWDYCYGSRLYHGVTGYSSCRLLLYGLAGPTAATAEPVVPVRAAIARAIGSTIAIQTPNAHRGAPRAPKNGCSRGSHHSLLGEGAEDGSREGDGNRRWLDHSRGVRALPDTGLIAAVSDGLGAADATGGGGAQIVAGHLLRMDVSCSTHW